MGRLTPRSTPDHSHARRRLDGGGRPLGRCRARRGRRTFWSAARTHGRLGHEGGGRLQAGVRRAASTATSGAQAAGDPHLDDGTHAHPNGLTDGHGHDHSDPTHQERDLPHPHRPPAVRPRTRPPRQQARLAASAADVQRSQTEPRLSNVPVSAAQASTPTDRYNMFNACYGVQSRRTGRWLAGGTTPPSPPPRSAPANPSTSSPPHWAATCSTAAPARSSTAASPTVGYAATPGPTNDWVATMPGKGLFRLQVPGRGYLTDSAGSATVSEHRHPAPSAASGPAAPTSPR